MGKHKCPEFENHERWLVSYADMLTLLFAVFVVLFALKDSGDKSQDAAGSLEESFNKPLEDIPPAHLIGPKPLDDGTFDHLKGDSAVAPLLNKFSDKKQHIKLIDEEMNKISKQLEERLYGSEKHRAKGDTGHERIASVVRTKNGFKIRLLARHFYAPGTITVKKGALKDLDKVITLVKALDREVRVEGHSDSLQRGDLEKWDHSALRATHVLKYMINNHSYPPSQLSAAAYGDAKPMASNSTAAGRAMNRRIEFNILYDDESSLDTQNPQ